jgi:hypothetical protein
MARGGGLAALTLALLAASPAAANPLSDCFERIAVVFHPHRHPAHAVAHRVIHRIHHVRPKPHPRPHRIAASGPSRAYAHRTGYILRPIACETHPATALMSPVPGAEVPETPQVLLAELAGPPVAPAETAAIAPEVPAAIAVAPPEFFPNIFGGPGGVPLPGGSPGVIIPGVISPGGPPVTPPVGPVEVTPPPVTPPVTPPIVTPIDTTVTPPVAPPVIGPPPGPPGVETPPPPNVPGGPGVPPVGGVPEPATWGLMLVGFFGLGGALRRRRRALRT